MAEATIQVKGARELARSLRRAGVQVQDLKAANERVGLIVVTRAKALAPSVSGAMAGSIRASRKQAGVSVRAGGGTVPYAAVIQWGWAARNITPAYYLTNGLAQSQQAALDAYYAEVDKLLDSIEGAKPTGGTT